ncbi:dihydropteroate synthase [Candidatus Omnitrophota bacterium]
MFIIGERINGMFNDVADALKKKDESVIQGLAEKQIACGANALDVNVGPSSDSPKEAMQWLVRTITAVTDITLAIDTTKNDVMEAGLSLCKSEPIINSVNANQDKMNSLFALAKKYNASIIGLTMDKSGIPKDAEGRLELGMKIVAFALEQDFDISKLYIDSVILPVNVAQVHAKEVLKTIRDSKMLAAPPPKTMLGLSNVSQGAPYENKPLINRTFMVMAIASGLDGAIMDVTDKELVDAGITAELLMEKQLYCDSYIEAYRKK